MLRQPECVLFPAINTYQSPVGEDSDDLLKSIRDLFAYSVRVTFASMDALNNLRRLLLDRSMMICFRSTEYLRLDLMFVSPLLLFLFF